MKSEIKTTVTYKGKPFDGKEWISDIKKMTLNNLAKVYERKIAEVLTQEELQQITLKVDFIDDEHVSCVIEGPTEIAKRAQKALGD
jgi:hypothetical protein